LVNRLEACVLQALASAEIFPGGATSTFCLSFQVADDAMQICFHKTFYPFYIRKKVPYVTVTVTKMRSLAAVVRIFAEI